MIADERGTSEVSTREAIFRPQMEKGNPNRSQQSAELKACGKLLE